jgi:BioD-like phosphotransacetylase family protein
MGDSPTKTVPDFEATLRRIMPEKTTDAAATEEEDLFDQIITRIRRAKSNQNFLRALKDWLDESGI